jgi:hypothetical protein
MDYKPVPPVNTEFSVDIEVNLPTCTIVRQ